MRTPNGRREVEELFGHPANAEGALSSAWERANIRVVAPPPGWKLFYQDKTRILPTRGIRVHRLLADSLQEVLAEIWQVALDAVREADGSDREPDFYAEATRAWLHERRLNLTGGGFEFRNIRDGAGLSMHAYGIAIDWDPKHNPRQRPLTYTLPEWWYEIWHRHGWSDGRHFRKPDPMHVQFATGV